MGNLTGAFSCYKHNNSILQIYSTHAILERYCNLPQPYVTVICPNKPRWKWPHLSCHLFYQNFLKLFYFLVQSILKELRHRLSRSNSFEIATHNLKLWPLKPHRIVSMTTAYFCSKMAHSEVRDIL